jgi:hypothetical protein
MKASHNCLFVRDATFVTVAINCHSSAGMPEGPDMHARPRHLNAALLTATAALTTALAIATTSPANPAVRQATRAAAAAARPRITSTLEGRSVLPHRIRWIAHPGLPRVYIRAVQFVIDGKLAWIERKPPYVYGDDSDWLVTSWLEPGLHRFTVRVIRRRGAASSRTTTARVDPTPLPPAELVNTRWQHQLVNQGELGCWVIRIGQTGWKIDDPKGGTNFVDVAYLAPGLVELRGGIWTRPRSVHEGNGFCEDTNQAVRYRWAVSGDQLTLALAGPKRCGDQATVLSGAGVPRSSGGTWTRA